MRADRNIRTDRIKALAILALAALMLMPAAVRPDPREPGMGTRAGEVGWQYDTFAENLDINVTPEYITTSDQIVVTITSRISEVWIKQASLYGVVYPKDGIQFPFSFPFVRVNDTVFRCTIEPFPLNGYDIEFYVVAYDYFYSPTTSGEYTYTVEGAGWKHDAFDDNVELTYWPLRANASEEVEVTIRSLDNVSIAGANLYVTYETAEGEIREGGWNFSKTNVNSTEMRQVIPGYPAGTNVTFWVTAWDQYNAVITSRMYNYSVIGVIEYTEFPFEYSDDEGNTDVWLPNDVITLSMAGMCALGIPLFIYLYASVLREERRARKLVTSGKDGDEDNADPGNEENTDAAREGTIAGGENDG